MRTLTTTVVACEQKPKAEPTGGGKKKKKKGAPAQPDLWLVQLEDTVLFPEGGGRVNIGIAYEDRDGTKNAREMFRRFLDRQYSKRLAHATPIGAWKGHPVAYSYRIEGLTSPGRIVVGESGLLTHPATAEGIYQGMRSGMMAAEALRDVLVSGADEAASFAAYESRCRKTFRASFLGGGMFRLLLKTPALDLLAKAGEQPLVRRTAARILASL